jgi:hypothetical protein
VTFYTPDQLQKTLDSYRQKRDSAQKGVATGLAPSHKEFMPQQLDFDPTRLETVDSIYNTIMKNAQEQTALEMEMARNRYNLQQYKNAQKNRNQVRNNFVEPLPPGQSGGGGNGGDTTLAFGAGDRNWSAKRWGADRIPEVSDLKVLKPNAPIVNVAWRGHNIRLNRQVAPIFVAFLDALWRTGYRPATIYGHAERNIAGTNTPSLHSYGFAIDIDPAKNPVTWNGNVITALPPGIGALAAKYGLRWGGSWTGSKTDSMHFSVPYGGTL